MSALTAVFKREFFGYFRTPVAYVFLAVFLALMAALTWFLADFFKTGKDIAFNDASLRVFFQFLPWVYLFLIPAVGMRLWAEEKRSGTWELLLTLPITTFQAVLGKYLAGLAFVGLALLLTFPMPITVAYLGDPDWGPIIAGYVGALLMGGAYLAVCSLCSSLTKNQVISFVISVLICFVLVVLGWNAFSDILFSLGLPINVVDAFANFSFITHFDAFQKGIIAVVDVLFFVALIAACLLINVFTLER